MIRFLIELICILYLVRVVARFLFPFLFQSAVKSAMNNAQQQQYRQQNYEQQRPRDEGRITIEHIPQPNKKKGSVPDSEGDFVDYEEIK